MVNEKDLEAALLDIGKSKAPNYRAIAEKHNVHYSTLYRRARGITVSRAVAAEISKRLLTNAQEEVILQKMEKLSNKGIYLVPRIVRNSVQAIVGHPIGKNWVSDFHRRHKKRVKSMNLVGFDRERVVADNSVIINQFFTNVRYPLLFYLV
jgi:transposase